MKKRAAGPEEMRKTTSLAIITLIFLTLTSAAWKPASAEKSWQYSERIDIYFAGDSGLWVINLTGGNITLPNVDFSSHPYDQVEKLELILFHKKGWFQSFNLFRQGLLYDTHLPDFMEDSAQLTVHFDEALSPEAASQAAEQISGVISDNFYLALTDMRRISKNAFEFVSPISPDIHFERVWSTLPTSLGGFSLSTSHGELLGEEASYISLRFSREGNKHVGSMVIGVLETNILSEEQFELFKVIPGLTKVKTSPHSSSSVIALHARNAFINRMPEDIEARYDPVEGVMLMERVLEANETIPNLKVAYTYSHPLLSAKRELNASSIVQGQALNVVLEVTNLGETVAKNVTLLEAEWWDPEEFEFTGGNLTAEFPELHGGQVKSVSYTLRLLYRGEPKSLDVPPFEVNYSSGAAEGLPTYSCHSNSYILWLGEISAPALAVRIFDFSDVSPSMGDVLTYFVGFTNEGAAPAERVEIEDKIIGTLEPGGSQSILMKLRPSNDADNKQTLHSSVNFLFNDKRYMVESPRLNVYFRPTSSLSPTVNIDHEVSLDRGGEENLNLTVGITVSNIGRGLIDRISLSNRLPEGAKYLGGNVSYDPGTHKVDASSTDLREGESLYYEFGVLIKSGEVVVFPEALLRCSKAGLSTYFKSRVNSYVDSLRLTRLTEVNETILGVNASLSLRLENLGGFPVYELSISQPQPTPGKVENLTKPYVQRFDPHQTLNIPYSYVPSESGIQAFIPVAVASGIVAGKRHNVSVPAAALLKVYRGLEVEVLAPASVEEGDAFKLRVTLTSDIAEEISNIRVSYKLPEVVEVLSKSGEINGTIRGLPPEGSLSLTMELMVHEPMSITLGPPQIVYEFRGNIVKYLEVFPDEALEAEVLIHENLAFRYGYAVLIALALGVGTVLYVRRIASPTPRERG